MAFWVNAGAQRIECEGGVVVREDYQRLVETIELAEQARRKVADAERDAEQLLENARSRAKRIHDEAIEEGQRLREASRLEGLHAAQEEWATTVAATALDGHKRLTLSAERIAELVSTAAERVIHTEDRSALYRRSLQVVKELLVDARTLVLHVGPEDADVARAAVSSIVAETGMNLPVQLQVDSGLAGGGCRLESDQCSVDASIGLQLQSVKAAIRRAAQQAIAGAFSSEPERVNGGH